MACCSRMDTFIIIRNDTDTNDCQWQIQNHKNNNIYKTLWLEIRKYPYLKTWGAHSASSDKHVFVTFPTENERKQTLDKKKSDKTSHLVNLTNRNRGKFGTGNITTWSRFDLRAAARLDFTELPLNKLTWIIVHKNAWHFLPFSELDKDTNLTRLTQCSSEEILVKQKESITRWEKRKMLWNETPATLLWH